MKHDDRNEVVKRLQEYAAQLAAEYGYTDMHVGEDRQKGVWGEAFTAWLEKQEGGPCATEIHWYQDGNTKNYVEFRFWFETPCVSVSCNNRETFCEISVSDVVKRDEADQIVRNEDGSWKKDRVFRPNHVTAWGQGCLEIANRMVSDIEKFTHPMTNDYYGD